MDGSIRIGAELVTDKFDKQIKALENKIEKEENKSIEIDTEISGIQEEINYYNEVSKKAKHYKEIVDKIQEARASGKYVDLEKAMEYQEAYGRLEQYLEENADEMEKLSLKEEKLLNKQKEINNRVSEYKTEIESVKIQKAVAETDKMKQGFDKVGSSIQNAIKKAGKMVLGIFAIRSAYMMLRRASSDLGGYDKEYAANLEYIRYVLTEAIAPVLKTIIQLAATLLNYLFQILNAWFGWNLGKTAKDFEAMKKSSGGVAKNMKEAEKATQGFDELNVLQDNSKDSGSSGYTAPTLDVSGIQGEPPAWLQWIMDHGEEIGAILLGIAGGLTAMKLGLSGLQSLGIGLMITGVIGLIQSLLSYLESPSWENFGKVIQNIGLILVGLAALIGNVPLAVAGAIALIAGFIAQHWQDIKQWWNGFIEWLKGAGEWIHQNLGDFLGGIWDTIVDVIEGLGKIFGGLFETIKGVFDGIIQFFKGVFSGDWSQAWEGIKKIFQSVWDGIVKIAQTIFDVFTKIVQRVWDAISGIVKGALNALFSVVEGILNLPIKAINGLIWVINLVPGVNIPSIQEIRLPRLKTGGIINMPNKGTMVGGSAIGGESGREGVIPLTDSQAMETLGENIGKYVTINATINNTMDGKLISRHIQKIQNQQAFAGNL